MANYKRKKSRYNFRCLICNKARFRRQSKDFPIGEKRNNDRIKEQRKDMT